MTANGYLSRAYAESFLELGVPRLLNRSQGWIIERSIPGFDRRDAMGCYPLFCCRDWSGLDQDLSEIRDLIAISMVADPFGDCDPDRLRQCFRDVVVPFKEHFVVDLSVPMEEIVSQHHRRNAGKGLEQVEVRRITEPANAVEDWSRLYQNLINRHGIKGIPAFSRDSFARQLGAPGLAAFQALHQGETIGMLLWYVQDRIGYYHLGAFSEAGYGLHASFAMFWSAIEYFIGAGLAWLDLGGGAGIEAGGSSGLARFKRGWSTGARIAYFCGRIIQQDEYRRIVREAGSSSIDTTYFPAYRLGEF